MEYEDEEKGMEEDYLDYSYTGYDKSGSVTGYSRDQDPYSRMLYAFLEKNYSKYKKQHSQIINIAKSIPNHENLIPGMLVSSILFILEVQIDGKTLEKYDNLTPEIFNTYSDKALKILLEKEIKEKIVGTLSREQIVKIIKGDLLRYLKYILK